MRTMVSVVFMSIFLVGCGMSHEEYEERIEYCESRGLGVKVHAMRRGVVERIHCVGEGGVVFSSRRGGK